MEGEYLAAHVEYGRAEILKEKRGKWATFYSFWKGLGKAYIGVQRTRAPLEG